MTIEQALFIIIALFVGSLPFSVWVGRFGLGTDIRDYGDGNPGAFNVLRSGGVKWFIFALMLDISKGAAPVGLAYQVFGWDGVAIILIAVAPILGHAFSPFLGFKGGKAIATTFGIWIGLTLWVVPLVAMITLIISYKLLNSSGWATIITLFAMLAVLLIGYTAIELYIVWGFNLLLVIYKHRDEITTLPKLRSQTPTHTASG